MEAAETLQTLAEVGIALTGFTGIVVVVGERSRGDWSRVELGQLHDLLWASLSVVLFAFLPLVVAPAVPEEIMWRVLSGAFALGEVAFMGHYWWRGSQFFRDRIPMPAFGVRLGFFSIPFMLAAVIAKLGVALGYLLPFATALYMISLFGFLLTATVNFVFLLLQRIHEAK